MIAAQWERAQAIFLAIVDQPRDAQRDAVHQRCPDDPALATTILEMLDEDRRRHSLLDADLSGLAQTALRSDQVETLVEQQIGPYRLVRLLGEGGTGVVYLAERLHIGGNVAIKLLRHAWLSPMRRDRFAQEQQTLAQLNHPGIARIYDANTLSDGTPWFVMEFVDGHSLTHWLHLRGGGVRQDLVLFRQICEAVRYAHSHAIVHRDLKPSNILVTPEGVVKLLDFGIAKQLHAGELGDQTLDGLRMLTPAYAAPEQSNGEPVGVFTDVYALGVILYEILADTLPPPAKAAAGRETDHLPKAPSAAASAQSATVRRNPLPKRDWADLDVLCLTALEPEPERRYHTVDALLQDLDAFLDGRPLLARPRSRRDIALKFARRHSSALISAALAITVFLVAFTVFTIRLAHARDAAVAEAARVNRLRHFTESLFDGGDAEAGPSIDIKTSDLLRRGEVEAESLREDPQMQADMFATLGTVYQRLGSLDKANSLLERALDQRLKHFGDRNPQYAESLLALGLLRKDQRRMDEAETLLRDAVARQRSLGDDAALAQSVVGLASALSLRGQYKASQTLLEEAVQLAHRSHTEDTAQYAETLSELADVYFYQAVYDRAEALNRQALALDRKLYGDQHPKTAQKLSSLGEIAKNRENIPLSESLLRQALAADSAWYGENHPDVATDLSSLSHVLILEKHYDEAELLLQRALSIQQHSYGEQHSEVASTWNEIGVLAYTRDQDDQAELSFRKALAIYTAVYGPNHQFVGLCYSNLIGVYMHRKDFPTAEQYAHKALDVYHRTLPEDHINPAIVHIKLGRSLLREKRYTEAEPESLKGYRYFARHNGEGGSYLLGARHDLTEIAAHLSNPHLRDDLLAEIQPKLK